MFSTRYVRGAAAALLAYSLLATVLHAEVEIRVAADRETGLYKAGEKGVFNVSVTEAGEPVEGKIEFRLLQNGRKEMRSGPLPLAGGTCSIPFSLSEPGAVLCEVDFRPADGDQKATWWGGAAFAPEEIPPSMPPPNDFEQFWKDKLAELNAVPMNPKLEPTEKKFPGVAAYKITMDNIRGTHIHGFFVRPSGQDGKFPAILQVQYAGVYAVEAKWIAWRADTGALAMVINAHDIPNDREPSYYVAMRKGQLNNYPAQRNYDREKSYFLRMFLSCYRAVDYLTSRPDWNGKVMVVYGGSQGGAQAIVSAALHPRVTAIAAFLPAMCDHTAFKLARAVGWPHWVRGNENRDAQTECSRYYDVVNFARRVTVPSLVGVGLIDRTCPPSSVYAAFNVMKCEKRMVVLPLAGHSGGGTGHRTYYKAQDEFIAQRLSR